MKILYFTRGQSPHDLRFLRALASTNHQVAVLCLEDSPSLTWPSGIPVLHLPSEMRKKKISPGRTAAAFRQIVNQYQPDLVHAGPVQRVAYIAALANVRPLLTMSWGSDLLLEADQHLTWPWITRYTLKKSTWFAADCQTVVNKARSFGYHGPVSIFPWGVDLDHFQPGPAGTIRQTLGWQNNRVFLSNRTMEPLYGVDVISRAFMQALEKDETIRLMLYGKGSEEQKIREILSDAEAAGKVYYGGFANLEDLPDIYRSADVYLSASHSDGSSVSLMEALACGKPVLVSDIPSNQEWIVPGKAGWLFKDGDANDLADKMITAVTIAEDREFLVEARSLAETRADWAKNFAILLDTYQKMIETYK
jgi:glycosyltransferase involved in cell wall biosynthesis